MDKPEMKLEREAAVGWSRSAAAAAAAAPS